MKVPYLIGPHYKGFIWDIPIPIFAYVLFLGPMFAYHMGFERQASV